MLAPLTQLEHFMAPWQSLFSNSKVISTSVVGAHVLSMFVGGGFAIAADRFTLRAPREDTQERARLLVDIEQVHRPVLISMTVLLITGVLLAASDVKTFATSPVFWVKIALVVLLLINGAVLTKTEQALGNRGITSEHQERSLWGRLRASSWCSLLLWSATLVAGVILQNAS